MSTNYVMLLISGSASSDVCGESAGQKQRRGRVSTCFYIGLKFLKAKEIVVINIHDIGYYENFRF